MMHDDFLIYLRYMIYDEFKEFDKSYRMSISNQDSTINALKLEVKQLREKLNIVALICILQWILDAILVYRIIYR